MIEDVESLLSFHLIMSTARVERRWDFAKQWFTWNLTNSENLSTRNENIKLSRLMTWFRELNCLISNANRVLSRFGVILI